ncbi:ATP synthase F0 subunit B [Granulicella sp. WH15]|uniref:F0F1 ATP synthase subunit B family protein n=1 Tax=Granulicella sp. WH15 TaxID=2602070 RepID=UPI001366D1FA|nr:ATP synthase F0 subunit B [Granulicella sp. WH15]QHN04556.1 ATP synthase F0 subunit B [Granulicella sp. WH15]
MNVMKKYFAAALLAVVFLGTAGTVWAQAVDDSGRETTPAAVSPEKNQQEKDENYAFKHSAGVVALGRMLGMNAEVAATTFEIANFVVLAGLVGFGMMKILPKTFRGRSAAIQKHLVDARVATEEASKRLSSVEARLAKLDGEIAAMKAQADKDAAADEARIKASVEEEKHKILTAAEQEIAAASVLAKRQLQAYAAELAIDQAARKLVVTAETDRLLVQAFAARLTGDSTKGGQN